MEIGGVNLKWLGHAGFLIENSVTIYIDPYQIKEGLPKADYIFLTHDHFDHCSVQDIEKILKKGTRIIMTAGCQSKIARFSIPVRMQIVEPGQELDFGILKADVFPAYNTDKSFHPKEQFLVGYLIKINRALIYHAGDTDFIPEMQKLTGYNSQAKNFVALLPVGGRYTMTAEEAAEAAKMIKPSLAIPMHWGSVVGTKDDAEEFKELCKENKINCEILEKE